MIDHRMKQPTRPSRAVARAGMMSEDQPCRHPDRLHQGGRRVLGGLSAGNGGQSGRGLALHAASAPPDAAAGQRRHRQLGSIGGLVGNPGFAAYHAAKHGVIGMTQTAALEYAASGIRLNTVCPGVVDTPMVAKLVADQPDAMDGIVKNQPIGRLGNPEEVAAAVLFLCSDAASFILGVALPVDGDYTAASGDASGSVSWPVTGSAVTISMACCSAAAPSSTLALSRSRSASRISSVARMRPSAAFAKSCSFGIAGDVPW